MKYTISSFNNNSNYNNDKKWNHHIPYFLKFPWTCLRAIYKSQIRKVLKNDAGPSWTLLFVELACGKQDIAVTILLRCMCVRACICVRVYACVRASVRPDLSRQNSYIYAWISTLFVTVLVLEEENRHLKPFYAPPKGEHIIATLSVRPAGRLSVRVSVRSISKSIEGYLMELDTLIPVFTELFLICIYTNNNLLASKLVHLFL